MMSLILLQRIQNLKNRNKLYQLSIKYFLNKEKLNFEHMAVAYILLGSGLGISSLGIMDLFIYCLANYIYFYTFNSVKFCKGFIWNIFLIHYFISVFCWELFFYKKRCDKVLLKDKK